MKIQSSRILFVFSGLALAGSVASTLAADQSPPSEVVARGEYLVSIAGCNDCHTPLTVVDGVPQPDMTRFLSGHPQEMPLEPHGVPTPPWIWAGAATNTAFSGPWGVSFAPNLTPDENTGIGVWTEEIFVEAIRTGRHWGQSRPILPPMPWPAYRNMTDEDLAAVFAYLESLPAIENHVPEAILAEPPPAPEGTTVGEGPAAD